MERVTIQYVDIKNPVSVTSSAPSSGITQRTMNQAEEAAYFEKLRANAAPDAKAKSFEQANGASFSREVTAELSWRTGFEGQSLELLMAIMDGASSCELGSVIWGFSAIALVTTGDRTLAGKFAAPWRYRSPRSNADHLQPVQMMAALRHIVGLAHCKCASAKARQPNSCTCVDRAVHAICDALRDRRIVEMRRASEEPFSADTAWNWAFSLPEIEDLATQFRAA